MLARNKWPTNLKEESIVSCSHLSYSQWNSTKRAFSISQSDTTSRFQRQVMEANYHYKCFSNKGYERVTSELIYFYFGFDPVLLRLILKPWLNNGKNVPMSTIKRIPWPGLGGSAESWLLDNHNLFQTYSSSLVLIWPEADQTTQTTMAY